MIMIDRISYAITVCNERTEIEKLLKLLHNTKREMDEIVVLFDTKSGTKEVKEYVQSIYNVNYNEYEFDGDFSKMKNYLNSLCQGDYIFQLDADEMITDTMIINLPIILQHNSNIDLFYLPRINIVEGITDQHMKLWGWKSNEYGYINYPDYQGRIYKKGMVWKGKVHERIVNVDNVTHIPEYSTDFSITHIKSIEKQVKQNDFYRSL